MAKIAFRAILEVLGKPKEHVEEALRSYLQKLKEDSHYRVTTTDYAEAKLTEEQDLWSTFAELELEAEKMQDVVSFCFDYMPSIVEILEPEELVFSDAEMSNFLNDLQAKLHGVDMVAKQAKLENDYFKKNMAALLKNYLFSLLYQRKLTSEQLSKLTGVSTDKVEDFLDTLIDEGKIDLKDGYYFIKPESLESKEDGTE